MGEVVSVNVRRFLVAFTKLYAFYVVACLTYNSLYAYASTLYCTLLLFPLGIVGLFVPATTYLLLILLGFVAFTRDAIDARVPMASLTRLLAKPMSPLLTVVSAALCMAAAAALTDFRTSMLIFAASSYLLLLYIPLLVLYVALLPTLATSAVIAFRNGIRVREALRTVLPRMLIYTAIAYSVLIATHEAMKLATAQYLPQLATPLTLADIPETITRCKPLRKWLISAFDTLLAAPSLAAMSAVLYKALERYRHRQ